VAFIAASLMLRLAPEEGAAQFPTQPWADWHPKFIEAEDDKECHPNLETVPLVPTTLVRDLIAIPQDHQQLLEHPTELLLASIAGRVRLIPYQ